MKISIIETLSHVLPHRAHFLIYLIKMIDQERQKNLGIQI